MGEVARLSEARRVREDPAPDAPQTFDAFFEDEKDGLLRALAVITGSRAEAEDIAQEAFTNVFERWSEVRDMDNPTGYLYRSAINTFRSGRRRAGRALRRAVGLAPPPDVFAAIEDRDVALHALSRLTPRQRAALVLTEGLGYSGEEAGALLGIKASTVWALTHQARASLSGRTEETPDD